MRHKCDKCGEISEFSSGNLILDEGTNLYERDVELLRLILVQCEAGKLDPLKALDTHKVAYHVKLAAEIGWIEGKACKVNEHKFEEPYYRWFISDLNNAGHEFLSAARSDTVWKRTKENVIKPGASWTLKQFAGKLFEYAAAAAAPAVAKMIGQ